MKTSNLSNEPWPICAAKTAAQPPELALSCTNSRYSIAMKRGMRLLLSILASLCAFAAWSQNGVWSTNVAAISSRALGAAATVSGKVYMVGGGNWSCGVTSALQAYDPVSNTWSNLANMPTARYEFGTTELNGQLYAIAGNPGCGSVYSALRTVEAYDPVSNTWSTKAPLPTGSWEPGVASVNGAIYVIGGFTNYVYAYDPASNTWYTKSPVPLPYSAGTVAVVGGIIYVIGGNQGSRAAVQAYNPATDTWATRSSMPTPRYETAGAAVNGIIYVAGGYSSTGAVATVEAYNPASDTWSAVAPLPLRLWTASAAALNGTLYVMGGFDVNNSTLASVESFTPSASITGISMYAGLTITGTVGSTNVVEYVNDMAGTNWNVLTTLVLPVSPYLLIDTNSANVGKRFYRVLQQ